jgi:hypothetical protein
MCDVNKNVKKIAMEYGLLFLGVVLMTVGIAMTLSPIIRGGFQALMAILELSVAVSSLVIGRAMVDYSAYLAKKTATPLTIQTLGETTNSNRLQS